MHGNYGLSYEQSKSQLTVWAMLAAPFLLSTDLRTIKPKIKELLLNRDVIAVDQDALGISGRVVSIIGRIYTWTRPVLPIISGQNSFAVAFVSRRNDGVPFAFNVTLADLELTNPGGYDVKVSQMSFLFKKRFASNNFFLFIQDLYNPQRPVFRFSPTSTVFERINPVGAHMYRFTPV